MMRTKKTVEMRRSFCLFTPSMMRPAIGLVQTVPI